MNLELLLPLGFKSNISPIEDKLVGYTLHTTWDCVISIAVGAHAYCTPRVDMKHPNYDSVEIAFFDMGMNFIKPSQLLSTHMADYYYVDDSVLAYVPTSTLIRLLPQIIPNFRFRKGMKVTVDSFDYDLLENEVEASHKIHALNPDGEECVLDKRQLQLVSL